MRLPAALMATLVVSAGGVRKVHKETCGFQTTPTEGDVGDGLRSFVWTEPYRSSLFEDGLLLNNTAFQEYTQWLENAVAENFGDVDPFNQTAVLIRQRDLYIEFIGDDGWAWDVLINGLAGTLSKPNCIESALWAKQNELHPLSVAPSEFGAFILLDCANTTVKVFAQTGPNSTVPYMAWAENLLNEALNDGYRLLTFLHNHPFRAHQPGLDVSGTILPSDPDLRAFQSDKFLFNRAESFWITNGHDSFRIPASELGIFESPPATMGRSMPRLSRPEGPLDLILPGAEK